MRQISDEGRREIAKELREQFYCCQYAEEFTEGLYDVLDLGHCEPAHGGYPDLAERLADYVEPAPVTGSTGALIRSAAELFRATAWRTVPDLVSGPARRALAHGRADAPRVTAAQIGETERRARALERDRARALKRSRKAKR